MVMVEISINGMKIGISTFIRAQVGEYTVYNNKIFRITSSSGQGISRSYKLERPDETCVVKGNVKLMKIIYPSGYISL